MAVDADLSGSTTLKKFADAKPSNAERFFNVGIAEQNTIDVAAGLSLAGHIPFTGSFAVFGVGRAYDRIRNTVAYLKLNVKLTPRMPACRWVRMAARIRCSRTSRCCVRCPV